MHVKYIRNMAVKAGESIMEKPGNCRKMLVTTIPAAILFTCIIQPRFSRVIPKIILPRTFAISRFLWPIADKKKSISPRFIAMILEIFPKFRRILCGI